MPEGDILGLRDRMVADVATLRSKRPDLKIELLCDGAPEMWNLLDEGFTPQFRRRPPPSGRFLSPDGKAGRCSACARGFGGGGRRTARRLEESLTPPQPRGDCSVLGWNPLDVVDQQELDLHIAALQLQA